MVRGGFEKLGGGGKDDGGGGGEFSSTFITTTFFCFFFGGERPFAVGALLLGGLTFAAVAFCFEPPARALETEIFFKLFIWVLSNFFSVKKKVNQCPSLCSLFIVDFVLQITVSGFKFFSYSSLPLPISSIASLTHLASEINIPSLE